MEKKTLIVIYTRHSSFEIGQMEFDSKQEAFDFILANQKAIETQNIIVEVK